MRRLALLPLALLVTGPLWLPAAGARAEDPPEKDDEVTLDAPPPALPTGRDAFLEPMRRPNLIDYLAALQKQIAQFESSPPHTEDVTALYDAWKAILRPRVHPMLRRIEKWQDPKRWLWEDGETMPTSLKPDQWSGFTRDMARLATEIHGAYKQYGSVELKPKRRQAGYAPQIRPPQVYLGYPYPSLYGSILDRQAAGSLLGRWASGSYWHLLDRFRYAWDWSWYRRAAWYEHWRKRQEATDDLFESLRSDLAGTRDVLGQSLLGLQAFLAALQNAEEERLLGLCESCRTDDETLRAMGETALRAMADSRLEAERYRGDSSAAYGTLLRKWLRAQRAAVEVMDVAHEDLTSEDAAAEDEDAEEREPAGDDPAGDEGR
jgi:hypothetical protein